MILTTKTEIEYFQLRARLGALKLETLGMKHSSGKSMYAAIKASYGLKGNKQSVLQQFEQIVAKKREELEQSQQN